MTKALYKIYDALRKLSINISGDSSDYVCSVSLDTATTYSDSTIKIPFDRKICDPLGMFDSANNEVEILKSGYYSVFSQIYVQSSFTGHLSLRLILNGNFFTNEKSYISGTSGSCALSNTFYFEKGDKLSVEVDPDSNCDAYIYKYYNILTVAKINPQNAVATEFNNVYKASAYLSSDWTYTAGSGFTAVPLDAKSFDPNNDLDLTNSKYVVPISGYYQLNGLVIVGGVSSGEYYYCALRKNGSDWLAFGQQHASTAGYLGPCASLIAYLEKGDEIDLLFNSSDSSNSLVKGAAHYTYMDIHLLSL